MLQKYQIELTLLLLLALVQSIQPAVDFVRFFNLDIKLLLKLTLHISLSDGMKSKVLFNLSCKLLFSGTHLPYSLHKVGKFSVASLKLLILLGLYFSTSALLPLLFGKKFFSFIRIQESQKLTDFFVIFRSLYELLGLLVQLIILRRGGVKLCLDLCVDNSCFLYLVLEEPLV